MSVACARVERPILFSGPMVRAILDGLKSQTRRGLRPQPKHQHEGMYPDRYNHGPDWCFWLPDNRITNEQSWRCPYGEPGDRLWVRETWRCFGGRESEYQRDQKSIIYRATADTADAVCGEWRPSIFMPRWACRIELEIVNVRIERVNEISHEDAVAEGCYRIEPCEAYPNGNAWGRAGFAALWDKLNKSRGLGWDAKPYVWVVEFKRHSSVGE